MLWITIAAGLLLAGAITQLWLARRDQRRFPPPGQMVSGLHVRKVGDKGPVVVFEAGIAASCLSWEVVQSQVAAFATTYSYDRAGYGWSGSQPGSASLTTIADNLHTWLQELKVPRPFILVGHSFGGYISRFYVQRYPGDVAGLVLVDPVTPEEWMKPGIAQRWRVGRAVLFTRAAGVLACFGLARTGLWILLRRGNGNPGPILGMFDSMRRIASEVDKLGRRRANHPLSTQVDETSPAAISPEHQSRDGDRSINVVRLLRARWSVPRFFWTMASYLSALPECAVQVSRCALPANMSITVLSGAHQPPERLAEHAALATTHIIARQSAHWVHLDEPELVVNAIRKIALQMETSNR